ncbi:hypothetical protein KL953_33865 [Mycolicibacterium goodii]|nr:hypothetical protein [Mycolicibacterium goodii]
MGVHPVTLSKWIKQDDIDRGVRPGVPTSESTELRRHKELHAAGLTEISTLGLAPPGRESTLNLQFSSSAIAEVMRYSRRMCSAPSEYRWSDRLISGR